MAAVVLMTVAPAGVVPVAVAPAADVPVAVAGVADVPVAVAGVADVPVAVAGVAVVPTTGLAFGRFFRGCPTHEGPTAPTRVAHTRLAGGPRGFHQCRRPKTGNASPEHTDDRRAGA
ncbi:hypothetical protein D3C59_32570 [Streptomyces sp. SHP22-7]|nr:hypothetical protein D3C59_32570 [Streptomyces sp. SHP22-7]